MRQVPSLTSNPGKIMRQVPALNSSNIVHCVSQTVAGSVAVRAACAGCDPLRDDTVYHS